MATIEELEKTTIHDIIYQYAGSAASLVTGVYQIFRGVISGIWTDVDAIFVTSDMQGREAAWLAQGNPRPLGLVVAEELAILAELGEVPAAERIGVILAGDVFADTGEQRRGQSGDASLVWQAFASRFAWVAGVPGNHDRFPPDWPPAGNIHLLDGDAVTIDGLRLAGLGGIIGNPRKPMRRSTETYLSEIKRLLADSSDILILHEGPDVPQQGFVGSELIRLQLYDRRETLVIAGHSHWTVPLITWDKGLQVLNVDSRGFLLNVVP